MTSSAIEPDRWRALLAQRVAELRRVPALVTRVVPELFLARRRRRESLVHALSEQAARKPSAPALLTAEARLDFRELFERVERVAALLEQRGVVRGDVVVLSAPNSVDTVSALLGASRLGAAVALVGADFSGWHLERALAALAPKLGVAGPGLHGEHGLPAGVPWLVQGSAEWESALASGARAPAAPLPPLAGEADFAYVFTSGTTGPSKAARVTHGRALLAGSAFGRLVEGLGPGDVVYSALPLSHSNALLLGLGACLVTGAALALRERFSAREFLDDVRRYDASAFLYVGELGRALVALPPSLRDRDHRLRLAVGNGMSADVWAKLQARFGVASVREFYAATEFPGAIANLTGAVGSVGHVPFERARGYRLVRVDPASGELLRGARGRAVPCRPGESGELVLRLRPRAGAPSGEYRGYVGEAESSARIARDVFRAGDVYCRSGDLLRRDRAGYYFFVDRLGDTFRFKGENVSTREVEEALGGLSRVRALGAVGVRVSGVDGQPGLLVLACDGPLDLRELAQKVRALPRAARPCFVRVVPELALTRTFKLKKRELAREGVDPAEIAGPLYYRAGDEYEPLDAAAWRRIVSGEARF